MWGFVKGLGAEKRVRKGMSNWYVVNGNWELAAGCARIKVLEGFMPYTCIDLH